MRTLLLILAALSLFACDAPWAKSDPSPVPATSLHVRERRSITMDGARIHSLSPDGRWFAAAQINALCVYATTTLVEQQCATLTDAHIDLRGVAWSPDSTRIALTEDAYSLAEESDLWVFDVTTGALTNLTDDGATGRFLKPEPAGAQPPIDTNPAWSPDGKTLLFARTPDGRDQTAIYRISASGGTVEHVLTAAEDFPYALHTLRWADDGQHIVYTIAIPGPQFDNPNNGVWIADQDGQNIRQVAQLIGREQSPVSLVDVTPQGNKALIRYEQIALQFSNSDSNVSPYALLDLSTGAIAPLKQPSGESPELVRVLNAVLSPDGSKILYAYADTAAVTHLVVRDVDGGAEQALLSDPTQVLGFTLLEGVGLDWAGNAMISVSTGNDSGLLLQLEAR